MPEQIESFLQYIQEMQPTQLSQQDWERAHQLYAAAGKEEEASHLINGLALQLRLPEDCISKYISRPCSSITRWSNLNYLQQHFNQEMIDLFRARALRLLPNHGVLSFTPYVWFELYKRFHSLKNRHLTRLFLHVHLSSLLDIPYENLVAALAEPNLPRGAAPLFQTQHSKKRKHHASEEIDFSTNRLILAEEDRNQFCQSPLKEKLRVTKIVPASPVSSYINTETGRTPGGQKVRLVHRTESAKVYVPITPRNSDNFKGALELEEISQETIHSRIKQEWEPAGALTFKATLQQMEENRAKPRPCSQFFLFKTTCKHVFEAHGIPVEVKSKGHDFHWTHLGAWRFTARQDQQNIVPATAAANYNILETVENDIAKKLKKQGAHISSIEIEVIPYYSGRSRIPRLLKYILCWTETNEQGSKINRQKEHIINTCSHQRVNKALLDTFNKLDELESENAFKMARC
ncbi:hypothetical protein Lbir_3161 [Legionella birminghamensis]|uniref:Type VII secretion system protein EssD-like domain-containing protein n=1 Tax=Legionella birminghamensis TaxID=28083 RepID=A0A378ILI6_9GAMM|nr:DNA/RNA non-specific endonuclease [Legionella birminghamensis]KTC66859.1 hypothetical protein Lbir_3161 [Legionella birminghamensis]STX32984.1 Uncharacterised protein [Legionella birminghamensis]